MPVRIVCISDTHNYHKSVDLPKGDILIHAGDATSRGYQHEIEAFGEWIRKQPFMYKIVIAGNHDWGYQNDPHRAREWLYGEPEYDHRDGLYYLQDEALEVEVDGEKLKIYGSPWQPFFCNWAFNLYSPELKEKWDLIPKDTDILVTHGPAYMLRDITSWDKSHVGCRELRLALQRVRPKLHVCGHIHESYGTARFGDTLIANAAICTVKYNPTQLPLVFEYDNGKMRQAPEVQGKESTEERVHEVPEDVSDVEGTEEA
jgi:predicted phosphodiesterase